ncbi:hypothetical protein VP01_2454g1 [Puccinia sorghi]|uniref:Uncharacterized protein n=1 Tax=Puccinia sorghi TaxID=27349 RepID=A0A0L6V6B1_9BASI|nr:hypothetical protein VP01_2454g1 [Puccinia sorghi]
MWAWSLHFMWCVKYDQIYHYVINWFSKIHPFQNIVWTKSQFCWQVTSCFLRQKNTVKISDNISNISNLTIESMQCFPNLLILGNTYKSWDTGGIQTCLYSKMDVLLYFSQVEGFVKPAGSTTMAETPGLDVVSNWVSFHHVTCHHVLIDWSWWSLFSTTLITQSLFICILMMVPLLENHILFQGYQNSVPRTLRRLRGIVSGVPAEFLNQPLSRSCQTHSAAVIQRSSGNQSIFFILSFLSSFSCLFDFFPLSSVILSHSSLLILILSFFSSYLLFLLLNLLCSIWAIPLTGRDGLVHINQADSTNKILHDLCIDEYNQVRVPAPTVEFSTLSFIILKSVVCSSFISVFYQLFLVF